MKSDVRGQPFATATVPLDQEHYKRMYRVLIRRSPKRMWLLYLTVLLTSGYCFYCYWTFRRPWFLFTGIGFALFAGAVVQIKRWAWLRDRRLDSDPGDSLELSCFEETLVLASRQSLSETEWKAMYKAFHDEEGLLIYPQRGIALLVPDDTIHPPSAIATILQKVNSSPAVST